MVSYTKAHACERLADFDHQCLWTRMQVTDQQHETDLIDQPHRWHLSHHGSHNKTERQSPFSVISACSKNLGVTRRPAHNWEGGSWVCGQTHHYGDCITRDENYSCVEPDDVFWRLRSPARTTHCLIKLFLHLWSPVATMRCHPTSQGDEDAFQMIWENTFGQ